MKPFSNLIDSKLISKIDKALDRFIPSAAKSPAVIHRAMRYSVFSGGKRLRPVLVLESSRLCGGRSKDALAGACAVELVHTYSLIHDDLPSMDDDDYRRGKPTCHKVFGEAHAILAGDALLTLAFNIPASHLEPKKSAKVIKELSEAAGTKGMVGGQILDLKFSLERDKIDYFKTARLFEASAKIGAIIAGAGSGMTEALAEYGASLGMAFQIIDDIIDGECYKGPVKKDKARRRAEFFVTRAKSAVSIFGDKADRLKKIADFVLVRKK